VTSHRPPGVQVAQRTYEIGKLFSFCYAWPLIAFLRCVIVITKYSSRHEMERNEKGGANGDREHQPTTWNSLRTCCKPGWDSVMPQFYRI
jgi:hypothetical protein